MCLIIFLLYLQENEDYVLFCLLFFFFHLQEYKTRHVVSFIQDMSLPLIWVSGVES